MSSTVTDLPTEPDLQIAHSVDSLSRLSFPALKKVFKSAVRPTSLSDLVGDPKGRMLAVRGTGDGVVADRVRKVAAAAWFPWNGKTFMRGTAKKGRGINRVHLWGRHQLFPFDIKITDSLVDGEPAVILDYDIDENPGLVRNIHDEIREVSPGLWMGPAMWKGKGEPKLLLWFALDWR